MAGVTYDSSTVWLEVQSIIEKSDGTHLFDYKGVIHTEKEDIGIWDMNPILTERDYLKSFGDAKKIRFKMPLGDYVNRLYPFRDNLEFTIRRTPIAEVGSGKKKNRKITVSRFKAIFNPANNPAVGASDLQTNRIQDLNTVSMVEIQLELVDRSLEPLRIKMTDGCYNNQDVGTVIKSVMGYESSKVLVDGKPSIDAINMVVPDNTEIIPHIVLPSGTHITNVTTFLQKEVGIYNRGIGTFFQTYRGKKTWFIYPTFDTERFDGKEPRVVFYAVPQDKLPQLDRSYCEEGDILKVAVTAQRLYTDSAELNLMNKGSGFRMSEARNFMKKPVQFDEAGPIGNRARSNTEVIIKNRKDGLNYAPVNQGGPSSNKYALKSKVLENTLGQIDIVWENGDEELIYPGMPCKYIYLSQGKAVSVKGTVLFVHGMSTRIEKNNTQAYRSILRLSIACEPFSHVPDIEFQGVKGEMDKDV